VSVVGLLPTLGETDGRTTAPPSSQSTIRVVHLRRRFPTPFPPPPSRQAPNPQPYLNQRWAGTPVGGRLEPPVPVSYNRFAPGLLFGMGLLETRTGFFAYL